ncbi:hypothetical protein SHAM105786_17595 [Shewanella amazonensis]|uniref:Uncharacterized protein n=1 Tax=Shewanella amazonensis (strain ATCC BAA-1098 / SB2B) TaxID=326297 RepID=A1S1G2_SHEAM|nr:hypothetical protein [Shewanella amazonensis]ABL98218.1 conserved hypothetical protein [Shewanella amazonensis SB2B]
MKNFTAGLNNFWVGLVTGLLMPLIVVATLLYLTVDKLTGVVQDSAISPFLERSEQTLDKVDSLLVTLDSKVDSADLKDLELLTPLKNANILPDLQDIASAAAELKTKVNDIDRETVITALRHKLTTSLAGKFPEEKAQELAIHLESIARLLAQQSDEFEQNTPVTQ